MAKNMSKKLIEEFKKNANITPLKIVWKKLDGYFRGLRRFFYNLHFKPDSNILPLINFKSGNNLNPGYFYQESVINLEFYEKLVSNLPPSFFFLPRISPLKYYDYGFQWVYKQGFKQSWAENGIKKFPYMLQLYEYFKSDDFCKKVSELVGDQKKRVCYSILCSRAKNRSALIPHTDSAGEFAKTSGAVNFIFFIDGNDSDILHSGGTGMYLDNEFNNLIFVPKTLKNSLLAYDINDNYYHGFKIMKKQGYRFAITSQYLFKEFAENPGSNY